MTKAKSKTKKTATRRKTTTTRRKPAVKRAAPKKKAAPRKKAAPKRAPAAKKTEFKVQCKKTPRGAWETLCSSGTKRAAFILAKSYHASNPTHTVRVWK